MEGEWRGRTARQWHRSAAARPADALARDGCGMGGGRNAKRAGIAPSAFWNIQRTGLIGGVGHVVRVGHDSRAAEQRIDHDQSSGHCPTLTAQISIAPTSSRLAASRRAA